MPDILVIKWDHEAPREDKYGIVRVREPNFSRDFLHTHQGYCELFWIEQGRGVHLINGKRLRLNPGDLVMMRENDIHMFKPCDKLGFIVINLSFPLETLEFIRQRYAPDIPGFFDPKSRLPPKIQLNPHLKQAMEAALPDFAQPPRNLLKLEAFLLPLLRDLYFPAQDLKLQACPAWLTEACHKIREPHNLRLGIKQFFNLAYRTQAHVSREAKRWLGKTPTDIVNQARLEYVTSRLNEDGQEKLIEIALDAGFENLGYFFKVFKLYYGTTPRQYRLRNQVNMDTPINLAKKP